MWERARDSVLIQERELSLNTGEGELSLVKYQDTVLERARDSDLIQERESSV